MIIARVENGVTIFLPKRQKTPKISKRNWIRNSSFQWEIFIFLAAGKLIFERGGVSLQNWLASDHPGAYTSMPHRFFGANKDVCYIEKKVAK